MKWLIHSPAFNNVEMTRVAGVGAAVDCSSQRSRKGPARVSSSPTCDQEQPRCFEGGLDGSLTLSSIRGTKNGLSP